MLCLLLFAVYSAAQYHNNWILRLLSEPIWRQTPDSDLRCLQGSSQHILHCRKQGLLASLLPSVPRLAAWLDRVKVGCSVRLDQFCQSSLLCFFRARSSADTQLATCKRVKQEKQFLVLIEGDSPYCSCAESQIWPLQPCITLFQNLLFQDRTGAGPAGCIAGADLYLS